MRKYLSLVVVTFLVSILTGCKSPPMLPTGDSEKIQIRVTHTSTREWRATYTLDRPTTKLIFTRDQNVFRHKIFRLEDEAFVILQGEARDSQEPREYIARKDGKPFQRVSFTFGPFTMTFPAITSSRSASRTARRPSTPVT